MDILKIKFSEVHCRYSAPYS